MKKLKDTDRAWLAALVDGEGSILVVRHRRPPKPNGRQRVGFRVKVAVYNTHRGLIETVVRRTGLGAVQKVTVRKGRKPMFRWLVQATASKLVLPELLPWLIVKKERAKMAMEALRLLEMRDPGRAGSTWDYMQSGRCDQDTARLEEIAETIGAN